VVNAAASSALATPIDDYLLVIRGEDGRGEEEELQQVKN